MNKQDRENEMKEVNLFQLIPFDIVGEEDFLANNNLRSLSVKCTSADGEVYRISSKDFKYIILENNLSKKYL